MVRLIRKMIWWTERRRRDDELRDELQFHLDEETEQRQAQGLSRDTASWAAHKDLGNLTLLKEDVRTLWTWTFLEQLAQDLRYAGRTMVRNRSFTVLVALSLALGIGANTAIYSFIDAILLRSLPVADPASLVVLNWRSKLVPRRSPFVMHSIDGRTYDDPKIGRTAGIFPYPAFEVLQKNADAVFSSVFAYKSARNLTLLIDGEATLASGEFVSGDFFRGLAVPPASGRVIAPDDDRAGAAPVMVVSAALSQRRFGGPANATGRSIQINSVPFTVVGVAPADFFGVDPGAAPEFYLPMHANVLVTAGGSLGASMFQTYLDQNYYWIEIMGRLRPGVTLAEAQARLAPPFHAWVEGTATDEREKANLPALFLSEGAGGLDSLRRQYSQPLYVLLTLVGLILSIACANTANLLLARAAARTREMAVRLGIGASRSRVIRQLLTESIALASVGGALGVLIAVGGVRLLTRLLANGQETFPLHAELNWPVLIATLALSMLCGTLFGLVPALQSTRTDVMPALKDTQASSRTRVRVGIVRTNPSHVLVVSQMAISLLLLVAAGQQDVLPIEAQLDRLTVRPERAPGGTYGSRDHGADHCVSWFVRHNGLRGGSPHE